MGLQSGGDIVVEIPSSAQSLVGDLVQVGREVAHDLGFGRIRKVDPARLVHSSLLDWLAALHDRLGPILGWLVVVTVGVVGAVRVVVWVDEDAVAVGEAFPAVLAAETSNCEQ